MDAAERDAAAPLEAEEAARVEAARRQGFLPLLVLLERLQPGATDVGGEQSPPAEAIRFRHDPALNFTPGDVVGVEPYAVPPDPTDFTATSRRRWDIVTSFLGLTGTVSPLPQYMAEEIAQNHVDDRASRDFLDLFHHRAISLLARGLLDADPAADHRGDQRDPWSVRLLALLGVDPELRDADGTAPVEPPSVGEGDARWLLLRAAALLTERAPTAAGITAVLRDALHDELAGAPLEIEQFRGVRVPLAEPDLTRLGVQGSTLGRDVVVGKSVLDRTGTVGVVVGPVGREGYRRFAVERSAADKLRATIERAGRGELSCQIELLLEPDAAPPLRLASEHGSRLGRDAWLGGQKRAARVPIGP